MWSRGSSYPVNLRVTDDGEKGRGVFAAEIITKGTLVREYVGELIDESESARRQERGRNYYVMQLARDRYVDATSCGNCSRLLNHACMPNCQAQVWIGGGSRRIGVVVIRTIKIGKEVTFHYGNAYSIGDCQCSTCNAVTAGATSMR